MQDREPFLAIKGLCKSFSSTSVLKDVDFSITKGEVCAILGPSGCGKSTFLRCINGLEEFEGGEVWFEGHNLALKETNWTKVRQKIGMVFQNYELFPHLNVLENVLLAPLKVQKRDKVEAREQAIALLSRVGLEHRQNALPKELSGGQKQRVAIVRALCTNPKLMLFDEVTASLDPEMVKEVLEVILELAREGMTMILVTHEMRFAQKVADWIAFFDGGRIVEWDRPKEFFTNPKTQRAKSFLNIFEF